MTPSAPRVSLVVLAFSVGVALACGGPTERGNREACLDYVDHMNSLDCMELSYDRQEMCEGAELSPADMVPYYDCAREQARCEEGQQVVDIASCRQPMM